MGNIEVKNTVDFQKILLSNPEMKEDVNDIVRQVLNEVRGSMRDRMRGVSTRAAYLAIRKSVYSRIMGGNINIATPRYKSGRTAPLPPESPRKKSNLRGGNRMLRSDRTKALLTYWGADRGFIMRFLNSGTPRRLDNRTRLVGRISPRNWFGPMGQAEMEKAAQHLDEMIERLINEKFNNQ